MFHDLKEAIEDVLATCDDAGCEGDLTVASKKCLRVLQAEYNIHFVEPDEEQLDIV
ncbi:MAG: hypothetical protein ACYSUK_00140 [Planctomycetota bacterium]